MSTSSRYKILVYGYGNPGRMDDGLGIECVNQIEEWVKSQGITDIEFDNNYQLNIEDADAIAEKDIAIFVDASIEDIEDFCLTKVNGKRNVHFTSHAASPDYVFYLCQTLYNKEPATYLLHIKGYEWEFKEGLTDKAKENLSKAIDYLKNKLHHPEQLIGDKISLKDCK